MTGRPPPYPARPNLGPLEYRAAYSNEHYEFTPRWYQQPGVRFTTGIIGGTGLSAIIWLLGWNEIPNNNFGFWIIVSIPFLKLLGGTVCLSFKRWRPLGAGLLTSIALGCLIFGYSFLSHCHY